MQERFGHPLVKKLEGMDNVKVIHPQGE
jgi:hypothetical protein